MSDWESLVGIIVGVLLSVLVPIAVSTLRPKSPDEIRAAETKTWLQILWEVAKPYVSLSLASLVVGFLTWLYVKYTGGTIKDWPTAIFTGYLWDATLQKVRDGLRG